MRHRDRNDEERMERVLAESVRLGNEITEMAATLTAFIDELEARRGGADAPD